MATLKQQVRRVFAVSLPCLCHRMYSCPPSVPFCSLPQMQEPGSVKAAKYCWPHSIREMVLSYCIHQDLVGTTIIQPEINEQILYIQNQVQSDVLRIRHQVMGTKVPQEDRPHHNKKNSKNSKNNKNSKNSKKNKKNKKKVTMGVVMECALDDLFWNFQCNKEEYSNVLTKLCQVLVYAHEDQDDNYAFSPVNDVFFGEKWLVGWWVGWLVGWWLLFHLLILFFFFFLIFFFCCFFRFFCCFLLLSAAFYCFLLLLLLHHPQQTNVVTWPCCR